MTEYAMITRVRSLDDLHKSVWREVHGENKCSGRDFLFHFSPVRPILLERPGRAAVMIRKKDEPPAFSFEPGAVTDFIWRASPLRRREGAEYVDPDPVAWAKEKLERAGFEVMEIQTGERRSYPWKPFRGAPQWLFCVLFTGRLRIRDPERARRGWAEGVGRHRGFGLGMLILGDDLNGGRG